MPDSEYRKNRMGGIRGDVSFIPELCFTELSELIPIALL